jgi:hypothetical protein
MKTIIIFLILFLSCFTINAQNDCKKQYDDAYNKAVQRNKGRKAENLRIHEEEIERIRAAKNNRQGLSDDPKESESKTNWIKADDASDAQFNKEVEKLKAELAKCQKKHIDALNKQKQTQKKQSPSGGSGVSTKSSTKNTRTKNSSNVGILVSKGSGYRRKKQSEQSAADIAAIKAERERLKELEDARIAKVEAEAEQQATKQISGITSSALSRVDDLVAGTEWLRQSGGVGELLRLQGKDGQPASGAMDTNPDRTMPQRDLTKFNSQTGYVRVMIIGDQEVPIRHIYSSLQQCEYAIDSAKQKDAEREAKTRQSFKNIAGEMDAEGHSSFAGSIFDASESPLPSLVSYKCRLVINADSDFANSDSEEPIDEPGAKPESGVKRDNNNGNGQVAEKQPPQNVPKVPITIPSPQKKKEQPLQEKKIEEKKEMEGSKNEEDNGFN